MTKLNTAFEKQDIQEMCSKVTHSRNTTDVKEGKMVKPIDTASLLMLAIFQETHPIGSMTTDSPTTDQYLQYCASHIDRIGRVFKFLGLAEEAEESTFGWTPTARLINIIAQRETRPPKASDKQATDKQRNMVASLIDLAGGTSEEVLTDDFFFCVLNGLGFLRETIGGECKPTALLQETVEAIFDR